MTDIDIFASLTDDLGNLGDDGDGDGAGPGLDDTLRTLIEGIRLVVSSYLGLSLTLRRDGYPVTLTALEEYANPAAIRTSLRLPLTALADVEIGSVLDLYAGRPGAFVDFAADVSYALHLSPDHVILDRHLTPPATESALTGARDLSHINRAVGVLISHGHTPEDAHTELRRRAHHNQTTVPHVARRLLASLPDSRGR